MMRSNAEATEQMLEALQEGLCRMWAAGKGGERSPEKLRPLHAWMKDILIDRLGPRYEAYGYDRVKEPTTRPEGREQRVEGRIYPKTVDVTIKVRREERVVGVVSLKFIASNYQQNVYNYIEQHMGERENLAQPGMAYGNLLVVTVPMPYWSRNGVLEKEERMRPQYIEMYVKLREAEHREKHNSAEALILVGRQMEMGSDRRKPPKADRITGLVTQSAISVNDEIWERLQKELGLEQFLNRMVDAIRRADQEGGGS